MNKRRLVLLALLFTLISASGASAFYGGATGNEIERQVMVTCNSSQDSTVEVPEEGIAFHEGKRVEKVECGKIGEYSFISKSRYERTREEELGRTGLVAISSVFLVMSLMLTAYGGRRKGDYRGFVKTLITAFSPLLLFMSVAAVSTIIYKLLGMSASFSLVMTFTLITFLGMMTVPLLLTIYIGLKREQDRGTHLAISINALLTQFFLAALIAHEFTSPMICCA